MKSGIASTKSADKPDTTNKLKNLQLTKMERATALYLKLIADDEHIPRKDIIDEFVKQCSLTPAGAATYFNTIKKRVAIKK
jgi:hypothetical protein